jgi:hypothetical protein
MSHQTVSGKVLNAFRRAGRAAFTNIMMLAWTMFILVPVGAMVVWLFAMTVIVPAAARIKTIAVCVGSIPKKQSRPEASRDGSLFDRCDLDRSLYPPDGARPSSSM